MRRAKLIVLSSLGVVLLTAAAAVIFLATAGDDFYRWALRQAIEGRLDRRIVVDGSFSFDVGLQPTLIVTDVWIENAPWASRKEIARAQRVEVQIALRPLLSGIVLVPRLVVEGLDVDLETLPDGQRNWEGTVASNEDDNRAAPEDLSLPLFEFVSLRDIAVTHRNRQSGRDTEVSLDFLDKPQLAGDAGFEIEGEGSFNRRPFQIAGRFGSLEQALAATTPYPVELTLRSSNLIVDLTGTVQDLAAAEGLDLNLTVEAPSISEVLATLAIEAPLTGSARTAIRLQGNLESLAVEDIALEVIEESGQQLLADGRVANLVTGEGLDLNFDAILGPEALRMAGAAPPRLNALLDGVIGMELIGRLTGSLQAPVVEDALALLEHDSGADVSLQGRAQLDFSEGGSGLAAFEASMLLFLPNPMLLEETLGVPMPDLGAVHVMADLAWAGDWISLRAAEVDVEALERLQLGAEGRIGKFSAQDLTFELDPRIDISATALDNQPLVFLLEALADETGRVADIPVASAQDRSTRTGSDLVLSIQRRLDSAGLDPGPRDGKMGQATRTAIEAYQARHGLTVDGRATEDLLRHLQGFERMAMPISVGGLLEALPEIAPVVAAVRLSREDGAFRFDDLNFTIGAKDALQVDIAGTLGPLRPERDVVLEEIALAVGFAVPSSQTFAQMLPPDIPEFRNVKGRFNVQGTSEEFSISEVRMTAEGPDGLAATVAGEGAKFSLATGVTEIALAVNFAVPSSQTFAHMLPPEAPELRNVTGRFDVGGSLDALSIASARIEAEGPNGLSATVDGQIGKLSLLPVLAIKDLAFDLEARSPGTDNVLQLVGLSLPELGPVRARATLRERDDLFTLAAIDVLVGPDNRPAVHATGQIDDLLAMKQIKLSGNFQIATARLLDPDEPIEKSPLGSVHGQFSLSDADGSIGIEALSAQLVDTDLLALSVKGLFDDLEEADELRFEATLNVPNVSELGREFGFAADRIGNLSFSGEVSGSDERFRAEGKVRLGETDLTGTLSGTLKGERPALRAKLRSPVFHLADFGLLPDADTPENTATAVKEDRQVKIPAPGFLFSEEPLDFSSLKAFDLDLDVQLDEVEGIQFDIDTANMQFSLEDGLLKVDPLLFNFAGGRIEMRLVVDARTEIPAVGLDIVADDVDLGDVLAQMEAEVPLDGELDTVLSLKASGLSPRALVSSFEGDLDLAISEGHIHTGLLDLTVTNPVGWMFSQSARRGYSELNCLVVRFDFEEGVATSVKMLLDTTNVRAEGVGDIDFQDETLDISVSPRAKRRRLVAISTPFAIEGPLSGPSVNVNATGAATRVIGQTVVSPLNLLGSLMPLVNDRGTDAENLCLRLK